MGKVRGFSNFAIVAAGMLMTNPLRAEVLAHCGPSYGKTFFVDHGNRWTDDAISGGSMTFTIDAKGNGNILLGDATGGVTDVAADGGEIILFHLTPNRRDFLMAVVFVATGVVETFNVVTGTGGERQVLWTTSRPEGSIMAKVAAFRSLCD